MSIQQAILKWHRLHGRRDLPWQQVRCPYRVWVSEVMLQQTQVRTVIDYFNRFIRHFPTVHDLALADEEQILAQWAGLGYYARARNLHKAARIICGEWGGIFPKTPDALMTLPGVGRSTAGAIVSLGHERSAPILDGNVKRVMTRYLGFKNAVDTVAGLKELWAVVSDLTPRLGRHAATYNQALMDLGATVCHLRQPNCAACPLSQMQVKPCFAFTNQSWSDFPIQKRKIKKTREIWILQIRWKRDKIWMEKRSSPGIWGGLWCPPVQVEVLSESDFEVMRTTLRVSRVEHRMHELSHKRLLIIPSTATIGLPKRRLSQPATKAEGLWVDPQQIRDLKLGLPQPIKEMFLGSR